MDRSDVHIVVPTYNEAAVIRETLQPLIALGYRVVVVDDGSTDGTHEIVRDLPVRLIRHIINLGQGAALQTGMDFALSRGARIIVHFDADGQHNHDDIQRLIEPIVKGQAEVALGSRFLARENAADIPMVKRLLLLAATRFTVLVSGIRLTDTHNGFRALSRSAAERIRIRENGMAHASEILHQIASGRLSYVEVPVKVLYTEYSKRKGQSIFNSINIVFDFITGRFLR